MCMGIEFWSCDIWPWSYDLDLWNLLDAPVPKVLMRVWLACARGLPMRGRCAWVWNCGPVTFDLGAMTLTLGIFWALAQCIDACMASLSMWTILEEYLCMGMELWSCDLWPWNYDLDLGNLVATPRRYLNWILSFPKTAWSPTLGHLKKSVKNPK